MPVRAPNGGVGRHDGRMRERAAATGALVLLVLAGCGSPPGPPPGPPEEASGTLEQLAAKAGCVPDLGTDAAEIRQANCRTGKGGYVLATFATDRGRQEWLDAANDYGGSYLVGRRWVAAGAEPVVTALRGRLGGTVTTAAQHAGAGDGGKGGGGRTGHGADGGGHQGHGADAGGGGRTGHDADAGGHPGHGGS